MDDKNLYILSTLQIMARDLIYATCKFTEGNLAAFTEVLESIQTNIFKILRKLAEKEEKQDETC